MYSVKLFFSTDFYSPYLRTFAFLNGLPDPEFHIKADNFQGKCFEIQGYGLPRVTGYNFLILRTRNPLISTFGSKMG
jgi:hypothetical protein